ncbi:NAD(P)H-quinone oxidoreductase subunit F [Synechococcus sp. BS56D]|uniref:NAD(P)H-quinone oxidoreductase subunit F n=1 Tax=Synechococcus sp. BS56D TaxID=2055944 RepID=UPI00103FCE3F|nr:NAD(P)H-quinone oxidoreductase subunit F [Synechococcus sp. BS56D]TCD59325.1 NAD(P)H-quinone oxidoreductase subunit F [Synechococcus sp. BS56D]
MSTFSTLTIETAWLIPLYGLAGTLVALPWAAGWFRRDAHRPPAYLNILLTLIAFVHGSLVLREVMLNGPVSLEFPWLAFADLQLNISFSLSLTNLAALELITGLSLLAQFYSLGYLDKEWALARFFALLGFFEGAMSGVVLSDSLFQSYFLLEMLTLSTYLLVGFWYAQPLVITAARDAFLTKRVGDVLLLMGVVSLAAWSGVMGFQDLYAWSATQPMTPIAATLLGLGLIAGPVGKCAQFPMHLWLDEAMEGPNPASILRNSVVVTCGAIVLLKVMPLLQQAPVTLVILQVIGIISALGGSLVSIAQVDIKRNLSYSTTAYLGLVFIAIALQVPVLALLLLFAHAVSKALLSMSVGGVIAATNCQDITELGGLGSRMPATSGSFLIGSLGLVGFLPFGGFLCLAQSVELIGAREPALVVVFLVTNALTALNLTRVYRQVFLGQSLAKTRRAAEINWQMALPMVALSVIVLITPLLLIRLESLDGLLAFPVWAAALVVGSGLVGLLIGALIPLNKAWSRSLNPILRWFQDLLAFDFYTERFYRLTIVNVVAAFSKLADRFDRTVVDGVLHFLARFSLQSADGLKLSISGQSQSYVLTVVAAIVLLLFSLSWLLN